MKGYTSKDIICKDITSEDIICKDIIWKDFTSKDIICKDITSKEITRLFYTYKFPIIIWRFYRCKCIILLLLYVVTI